MTDDELKLYQIRQLAVGVGRTHLSNGMDQLADAVLRIIDAGPLPYTREAT